MPPAAVAHPPRCRSFTPAARRAASPATRVRGGASPRTSSATLTPSRWPVRACPLIIIQRQLPHQPRHHLDLAPRHRQHRDHRRRPRAPRADGPRTQPARAVTPRPTAGKLTTSSPPTQRYGSVAQAGEKEQHRGLDLFASLIDSRPRRRSDVPPVVFTIDMPRDTSPTAHDPRSGWRRRPAAAAARRHPHPRQRRGHRRRGSPPRRVGNALVALGAQVPLRVRSRRARRARTRR
jgi:hypothetical protein